MEYTALAATSQLRQTRCSGPWVPFCRVDRPVAAHECHKSLLRQKKHKVIAAGFGPANCRLAWTSAGSGLHSLTLVYCVIRGLLRNTWLATADPRPALCVRGDSRPQLNQWCPGLLRITCLLPLLRVRHRDRSTRRLASLYIGGVWNHIPRIRT